MERLIVKSVWDHSMLHPPVQDSLCVTSKVKGFVRFASGTSPKPSCDSSGFASQLGGTSAWRLSETRPAWRKWVMEGVGWRV